MVVALVMTAWHVAASFLWIAPAGPARDAVPDAALRNYMLPMYGQSWSVFAPAPINGDHRLDIRAVVVENGEERVTDWVRATDVEISLSRHNLFPPRAANLAINVSSAHQSAYDDLNDDHEAVVAVDYVQDEWQPRLEEDLESDDDGAVDPYLEAEEELTAYATQVAYAVWGENVARVQFQTTRQNVVPFAERNDSGAQKPPLQVVNTGWRGLVERDGQSREQFADYFCSAPEDVCS